MQIALYAERVRCVKRALHVSSKKIDQNQTEFELQYVGTMGEYAVAKYFGLELTKEIYISGDDGTDIEINGKSCQVKTIRNNIPNPDLVFNDITCFPTDAAIGAKVISPIKIELLGCVSRQRFIAQHQVKDYGYGPRLSINTRRLTHVSYLHRFCVDNEAYVA